MNNAFSFPSLRKLIRKPGCAPIKQVVGLVRVISLMIKTAVLITGFF